MSKKMTEEMNRQSDIEPLFRQRVNEIYDEWTANNLAFPDALKQLENLRQEAIDASNEINEGGIYNILGIMYGYRSQYDTSIENFTQARDIFIKHDIKRRIASCDLNLGETYRLKGNFTRARQYFHYAYEEAKASDNISLQVTALTNEGQMWFSLNSLEKAKATLEEALELAETQTEFETERDRLNYSDNRCELHTALATAFLAENRAEMAWLHAVRSYEFSEITGTPVRIGYAHRALGDVMTELGESPDPDFGSDPDEHYQAAVDAFRQINAEGEVGKTFFAQGHSLNKRNKRRLAGRKFQQAMVIFTKLGMTDDASKAAEAQMLTI